jgi:ABC-type Mn2+/Zn2+ transport system ATPase subunit
LSHDSPILSLRNVCYSTPDGRSLGNEVSVELEAGQILLITGANGSGKSTLLDIILGSREYDSGTVQLNAPDACISYLPQMQDTQTHLPFSLRDVLKVSVNRPVDDDEITSHKLLGKRHLDLGWNSASGGEKRRTLLTRTFLQKPELIILDEPFNHLDSESRQVMTSSLRRFVAIENKCVILSTHEGFATASLESEALERSDSGHLDSEQGYFEHGDLKHGSSVNNQLPGELTIKQIAL